MMTGAKTARHHSKVNNFIFIIFVRTDDCGSDQQAIIHYCDMFSVYMETSGSKLFRLKLLNLYSL